MATVTPSTPIVKRFGSITWQISNGKPSELFKYAAVLLAADPAMETTLAGVDISRNNVGAFYLTLYFGPSPT